MSNLIRKYDPPCFDGSTLNSNDLGRYRDQVSSCNIADRNLQDSDKGSSVLSWKLPAVEKAEDDPERREDFKTKMARIEKEAYEKGFEQGQKDGLALEKSKMQEMEKQFMELLSGLRDLKPLIYRESEGELLDLSLVIARKIIGEEVNTNREAIGHAIRSAMNYLVDKRKIRIIINPDDVEDVRKLLPELATLSKGGHFQLTEDYSIEKGGCVLETGFGRINATIGDQIKRLEEEIDKEYNSKIRV